MKIEVRTKKEFKDGRYIGGMVIDTIERRLWWINCEVKKMKLELKPGSWGNLFASIRASKIESKGNFWAAVQSLEDQMEEQGKWVKQ